MHHIISDITGISITKMELFTGDVRNKPFLGRLKTGQEQLLLPRGLPCRFQHILNKNPISPCWVIHQDVGYRTHQLPILYNGTAAHE